MLIVTSDFSFAERAVIDVWVWLWFIQRVWSTDKFASLKWNKIRNFDLKSIITLLIFLTLPVQAIFDIAWTYLKYSEGYIVDPLTSKIYTKPTYSIDGIPLWSEKHILLKTITEYILAIVFALLIGTLSLMQAFWSHLSSQMGGKPFMRTLKFRFYVGWFFASLIIFPLARVLSSNHIALIENVPQLIFGVQSLIIFLLGIKNGKELNNLLQSIKQTSSPSGQETILRIGYFIEMNKSVMFGTLLLSVSMLIVTIDAIAFNQSIQTKILMDLFLIHANFGSLILWVTMILIIYPRYYITGTAGVIANCSTPSNFKGQPRRSSVTSLEEGNAPKDKKNNPNNSNAITMTSKTVSPGGYQPNKNVERSITNILEEQKHHIETYRHKTSTSISSLATVTSSHTPLPSPSFPPPPLFPPPVTHKNSPTV